MSNAHRVLLLLLSLSTGAAGYYGYRTHSLLSEARNRIATLEAERTNQRTRLNNLENQLRAQPPASSLTVPGDKPRAHNPQDNIRQIMEMRQATAGQAQTPPTAPRLPVDTAETQRLVALQQRAALDFRYAALFRQLHLKPEQLQQLKQLLVERQTASADVHAAVRTQGINPRDGREVIRELVVDAQSETDAKIRATVGEDVYNRFKTYEATFLERSLVNQLEQRLSYSSAPLTADQSELLVTLLAETATANPNTPITGSDALAAYSGRSRAPQISADTLSRGAGVLNAVQLAALKELQEEQAARARLANAHRNPVVPLRPATIPGTGQ